MSAWSKSKLVNELERGELAVRMWLQIFEVLNSGRPPRPVPLARDESTVEITGVRNRREAYR